MQSLGRDFLPPTVERLRADQTAFRRTEPPPIGRLGHVHRQVQRTTLRPRSAEDCRHLLHVPSARRPRHERYQTTLPIEYCASGCQVSSFWEKVIFCCNVLILFQIISFISIQLQFFYIQTYLYNASFFCLISSRRISFYFTSSKRISFLYFISSRRIYFLYFISRRRISFLYVISSRRISFLYFITCR